MILRCLKHFLTKSLGNDSSKRQFVQTASFSQYDSAAECAEIYPQRLSISSLRYYSIISKRYRTLWLFCQRDRERFRGEVTLDAYEPRYFYYITRERMLRSIITHSSEPAQKIIKMWARSSDIIFIRIFYSRADAYTDTACINCEMWNESVGSCRHDWRTLKYIFNRIS